MKTPLSKRRALCLLALIGLCLCLQSCEFLMDEFFTLDGAPEGLDARIRVLQPH